MKVYIIFFTVVLLSTLCLNAETLFEIKDNIGEPVFSISDDGLRVFNLGDTLMVISTTEAKINLDNSKDRGLSRSFSVTTSASKAGDPNVFEVTSDITNIATYSTTMRAGSNGRYTDFSPENVFLGLNAGWQTVPDTTQINTGQRNVFIGNNAGYGNSTGYDNIFVGTNSGYSISTGPSNTAMGAYSLSSTTWGGQNTAIGYESMLNSDHGMMNTALGMWSLMNSEDGSYNTCVGMYSGYGNKTGGYNTSIGYKSYDSGFNSGGAHTYCTFLGNDADITGVSTYTNGTAVGNGAKVSANDQVRVGNVSVTSIGGYVGWTTLGKKSYSKEVNENIVGLEFIKKLRPVSYDLDVEMINKDLGIEQNTDDTDVKGSINRSKNLKRSGFFAEEVLKAAEESGYDFTGLDKPGNKDDQYGLRYSEFVVPLIKAVQEQQEIIEKLEARIEELEIKTDK